MNDQAKIMNPIDAVILWVDGSDEAHFNKILPFVEDKQLTKTKDFRTRFDQVEEIKFTVDSILKYASFIRNIFIVTDNQIPAFLKTENAKINYPNVSIIDHKVIFKGYEEFLPTFNCRPIETQLYKIPNLAEHFVYFNDDMFLINKVTPNHFFEQGLPILRGKWLKFNEDVFYKKIKNFFQKKEKSKKAGHKVAQQKGAKIVGFKKYFKFHHTPYSLRKSTFEKYFKDNKKDELENVKHRFRSYMQYTPQGLINHIEIKNKTCVLNSDYQLLYIQSYKKPRWWYQFLLNRVNKSNDKLFLCLQSLDQCPPNKLEYILNWLNKKVEK